MKKLKKKTAVFLAALITGTAAFGGSFAMAADIGNTAEKEYKDVSYQGTDYIYAIEKTYTTMDPDEKLPFADIYKNRDIADTSYETIAAVPETEIKEIYKTQTYKDLESRKEAVLPQTITADGTELSISHVDWKEQDTTEHVSYTQQLGYSIGEPKDVPQTYDYTYTSPITKKEVTVTLPFSHLEKGEEGWVDGFSAKVTLENIDGEEFDFGSSTYSYSDSRAPGFTKSQYAYLISRLGYDSKEYRLTGASWSGKPYEKDGVTCRDAVCTGQQYGSMYEAVYADDVVNQKLYTAVVEYSGNSEIETGNTVYTIKAAAYYGEKKKGGWKNIITFVTKHKEVSAVFLFIALAVVFAATILLIKRKEDNYQKGAEKNE